LSGDIILAAGSEFISIERVGNLVRFTCFTPDCKVLMADSTMKNISDITIGDEVVTHTGKINKVIKLFKRSVDEEIVNINISGHRKESFKSTKNHPIMAIKCLEDNKKCSVHGVRGCRKCLNRYDSPSWIPADRLKVGDFIARKFSNSNINDIESINLSEYIDDTKVINGSVYSTQSRTKVTNGIGTYDIIENTFTTVATSVIDSINIDDKFLRLCGYYLAEGSCGRYKDGVKAHNIQFTISKDEAFGSMGNDIIECIKHVFGIDPKVYKNNIEDTAYTITLHSSLAARFISNLLPGGSHTKMMPQWMMELPINKQKEIIKGFMFGDGYSKINVRCKQMGFGIASEQLANQMCALFERVESTPIINYRNVYSKQTKKYHDRFCVTVQAADAEWLWEAMGNQPSGIKHLDFGLHHSGYTLRQIKSIEYKQYNGDVYNIEVENDHSYIVNGMIVHNCDMPISMSCGCEECSQIYFISDESDTRSIRPPSCNGIMPGVNAYGELKIYCYPAGKVFNSNSPTSFFELKGSVPTLSFTRYINGNVQNTAELNLVMKRNENLTTNVGWSFTPGPNMVPQCKWFVGSGTDGRQLSFEFMPESNSGLLGALLYNGHTITRRNGVVTGYDTNVLSNNIYKVKHFNIQDSEVVGDEFDAMNMWQITGSTDLLVLDKTMQLLEVGEMVELWQFEVSNVNGVRVFRTYFSKRPRVSAENLWNYAGGVQFGDLFETRDDINNVIGVIGTGTEQEAVITTDDVRIFENGEWGITGFDNDLLLPDDSYKNSDDDYEPSGVLINNRVQGVIDTNIPGMIVREIPRDLRGDLNNDGVVDELDLDILMAVMNTSVGDPGYDPDKDINSDGSIDVRDLCILGTNMNASSEGSSVKPLFLWHRSAHSDFLLKAKIGRPAQSNFPPYDIIIAGPIDSTPDVFMKVIERGIYETGPYVNLPFIKVVNHKWEDLPPTGAIRILDGVYREIIWKYQQKVFNGDSVILVGYNDIFPFDEDYILAQSGSVTETMLPHTPTNTVVIELLHADYTTTAMRLQFSINESTGQESVQLQFKVGKLSMSTPYELDISGPDDDTVRGFKPGEFTVSKTYSQIGFISDGIGDGVESEPSEFKVYDGGLLPAPVDDQSEKWNELIVLRRGTKLWVWWNNLLISPDPEASAALPTPVSVNTPYFPVNPMDVGKVGFRLWPTAVIRDVVIKDKAESFNEYGLGQISL